MRLTLVTALLSFFARAAEDNDYLLKDIVYDATLGCGECVAGGYSFCWKATSSGEVLTDKEYPKYSTTSTDKTSVCCKDNKDA